MSKCGGWLLITDVTVKHAGKGGTASAVGSPWIHNRITKAKSLKTEKTRVFLTMCHEIIPEQNSQVETD